MKIVRSLAAPQVAPKERPELHAAASDQDALLEVQHAAGALRGVRIVRDHDHRLALIAIERLEQVEDLVPGLAVEIARRLVAQKQRRVGDDRARDPDALLLAARSCRG